MIKKLTKSILAGIMCGVIMATSVGAATTCVTGYLETKNPIYSAPKGYAQTCGYRTITATCKVSKSGYNTKSVSTSKNCKSINYVETDWVSGPTWKSAGTTFTSKHTGYSHDGKYTTLTASKKY